MRAFAMAQYEITKGKSPSEQVGTTTLLGGILFRATPKRRKTSIASIRSSKSMPSVVSPRLSDSASFQLYHCSFVFGSLGDCKAFIYRTRYDDVIDLTEDNRGLSLSPTDCGGRLGPYIDGSLPDLRNFMLKHVSCEEEDLILVVSDGVHDNLDPQQLGVNARDAGLDVDNWSDANAEAAEQARSSYRVKLLGDIIRAVSRSPEHIVPEVLKHCLKTNQNAVKWMQEHKGKRLPFDYKSYPGKMDHTTCVCFKI